MDRNIIDVKIAEKKYDDFLLNGISFNTSCGDILAILGPNGNGKTTIIKCILNMTKYDGKINILGNDTSKTDEEYKEEIGVVLDEFFFEQTLNIHQLSKVLSYLYKHWDKEKFEKYIDIFELPKKKIFSKFSKGMKEKFLIAVALSHHVRLLILDEPTSGLDPLFRFEFKKIIKEYVDEEKASAIFTTHITTDVDDFANKIMIVEKGKSILYDDTQTLKNRYLLFKGNISTLNNITENHLCYYRKDEYVEALIKRENVYLHTSKHLKIPTLEEIILALCTDGRSRKC